MYSVLFLNNISAGHTSLFRFIDVIEFMTGITILYRTMENVAIKIVQKGEAEMTCNIKIVSSGAHDPEPISPIQALGVNPFPSRFIIRTVPRGGFARQQGRANRNDVIRVL